jgi:hypothetical protein
MPRLPLPGLTVYPDDARAHERDQTATSARHHQDQLMLAVAGGRLGGNTVHFVYRCPGSWSAGSVQPLRHGQFCAALGVHFTQYRARPP